MAGKARAGDCANSVRLHRCPPESLAVSPARWCSGESPATRGRQHPRPGPPLGSAPAPGWRSRARAREGERGKRRMAALPAQTSTNRRGRRGGRRGRKHRKRGWRRGVGAKSLFLLFLSFFLPLSPSLRFPLSTSSRITPTPRRGQNFCGLLPRRGPRRHPDGPRRRNHVSTDHRPRAQDRRAAVRCLHIR